MSVLLCARVSKRSRALTVRGASVCIERVKLIAFLLVVFVLVAATSCTTLVNRRDLYSPEPGPDSLEAARQWYGVTNTSNDDNPNTKSSGRNRRTGLSLLEVGTPRAASGRRSAPSLPVSRKEDSPLLAPHLCCRLALLWPAGVCALRFSTTTDGVVRNATSRPYHWQ